MLGFKPGTSIYKACFSFSPLMNEGPQLIVLSLSYGLKFLFKIKIFVCLGTTPGNAQGITHMGCQELNRLVKYKTSALFTVLTLRPTI